MKLSLIALFSMLVIQNVFAATEIKACSPRDMIDLNDSIYSYQKEGFTNVKLFKNSNKETVGFYAWNNDEDQIQVEMCEYIDDSEMTVANQWYYWETDNGSANPSSFTKNKTFFITQDEGMAKIKVLRVKAALKLEFTIIGWDEAGNEVEARKSVLTLE